MDEALKNYPDEYVKKTENLIKYISKRTISDQNALNGIRTIAIDLQVKETWVTVKNKVIEIANYLIKCENHNKEFVVNQENMKTITALILYFHGSKYFEKYCIDNFDVNASLKKGIYLSGKTGSGKTFLFRIFQKYTQEVLQNTNSFTTYESLQLREMFQNKIDGFEPLNEINLNYVNGKSYPRTIYINDIASNSEKAWGENVIENVLFLRDKLHTEKNYVTHVSSNYSHIEMIENKFYSERITDRMRSMFNFIHMQGESFRC